MNDNERILKILAHLRMNANEFASSLGYKRTDRIYNVINERNGISSAMARDIHKHYDCFNFDWIAYGTGEMLSTNSEPPVNLLNTPIPMESAAETDENTANVGKLANSFEELLDKYEDMTQQRDYWRNKATELEYKMAKSKVV